LAVLSSPPKPLGWALSIPGILIIVLLWFLLSNAFEEARKLAAYEQLHWALKRGKSDVASRDLRVLNETRFVTALKNEFDSLFVSVEESIDFKESQLLASLVNSITATANDDFNKALNSVRAASRFVTEGTQFAATLEDYKNILENATRASVEKISLEEKLFSLDRNGEKLKQEYEEAKRSLQRFLGFNTTTRTKEFTFYESGILAGLPTIKNLSDDIKDTQELKEALEKIGGSVHVSQKNPREEFELKISTLKEASEDVREPLLAYVKQRTITVEAIRRDSVALSSVREAIVETLSPKLLSNTRPSTSGFAESLHQWLKSLGFA